MPNPQSDPEASQFEPLLRGKLAGICAISDSQLALMRRHYELLVRWNRVLNLTSIRNLEEAVERHYCESVFAAIHLPEEPIAVADIGSGAGFPGIPIAIMRPHSSVTLIESHQRKASFLKEASRELANVRVIAGRAEDVTEFFDWVVSRAVRLSEIAGTIKRIGRSVQLLAGEPQPEGSSGQNWQPPIRLPWGEHRFLLVAA